MGTQDVDLSEFEQYSTPRKRECLVGDALSALPDGEAATLQAALDAGKTVVTNTAIAQWLKRRGYTRANMNAVASHRRETCSCDG